VKDLADDLKRSAPEAESDKALDVDGLLEISADKKRN